MLNQCHLKHKLEVTSIEKTHETTLNDHQCKFSNERDDLKGQIEDQ